MSGKVILIIIATINPIEKESLSYYLLEMDKMYREVKAIPVKKYKISESLIGEEATNVVSIMEFSSREALDKVFRSERYKELIPYRMKAFLRVEAMISEN